MGGSAVVPLTITECRLPVAERIMELAQDGLGPFRTSEIAHGRWRLPGGRRPWVDTSAAGIILRWLRDGGMASYIKATEPMPGYEGRKRLGSHGFSWMVSQEGVCALSREVVAFQRRIEQADTLIRVATNLDEMASGILVDGPARKMLQKCSFDLRSRASGIVRRGVD